MRIRVLCAAGDKTLHIAVTDETAFQLDLAYWYLTGKLLMSRSWAELRTQTPHAHYPYRIWAAVPIRIVNFSTRRHRFFEVSLLSDIKNLLLIKFIIYLRRESVV
jgi:hypothetical protein